MELAASTGVLLCFSLFFSWKKRELFVFIQVVLSHVRTEYMIVLSSPFHPVLPLDSATGLKHS
jgi:hypothetical protein